MVIDLNEAPNSEDESSQSLGTSADSGNEDDPIVRQLLQKLAPGSALDGLDAAYVLYCEYARHVGFSVRKGSQNYFRKTSEIQMKLYHCSCEGVSENICSQNRIPVYKKQQRRTSCKARLRVVREHVDGIWKVGSHQTTHNHELYEADQTYLLCSVRNLSHAQKSILEQMRDAGIGVSKACRFMEKESRGVQNVGFIRKDAYDHMNRIRAETKIPNGDARAIVQVFANKSKTEPFFYSNIMLDDEGRLMNFFFRDSRSAADYELFGDVLSVDTTFKTNKYNLICAPFVGINHHRQNVMFGLGFLSDETTKSFEWLFSTFLDSMGGKEPQIIFTDQCQALMNAVDYCFHTARHRLCQWHINQNAPSHFGSLNTDKEFKKKWHHCMNGCETEVEFQDTWRSLIDEHMLGDNTWFETMYRLRKRWAHVFTNDRFSAGMHATSRSEATNKVLKDLCARSGTLTEFVRHYEQIQIDWRLKERAEDALSIGMPGQRVNDNHLLTHAARIYTRSIYKLVEIEAASSINIDMIQSPLDYSAAELEFIVCGQGVHHRSRRVVFQQGTHSTTCTCRKWETEGLICRHMFKVFFTINIRRLPEQHILKRWTRAARNRSPNNIITPSGGDIPDDLLFVNNIMRLAYAIAYECKDNVNYRTSLHQCMTLLFNQACGSQNRATSSINMGSRPSDSPHSCGIRNPPTTNHAWYPRQRGGGRELVRKKYRNTKKGGAPLSTAGQDNAMGMDPHHWVPYTLFRNNLPGSMDYDACMETETDSVTPSQLVIPTQSSVHNRGDR